MTNSRLKDYLDLWVLLDREALNASTLGRAIAATFLRRGMAVPAVLPVGLSDEFANDSSRQAMWHAFLKKNEITVTPLIDVVTKLRAVLEPALIQCAGYRFAKPRVIQLRRLRQQTRLDVAQTLSVGELCKGHSSKLLRTSKRPNALVPTVASHNPMGCLPRQEIHDLGEQRLACVHDSLREKAQNSDGMAIQKSNRRRPLSL